MKKIVLLISFLIICSIGVQAVGIKMTMINQDPDPVRAGDVVDVKFRIENMYGDNTEDTIVEIFPDYPFSIYSDSNVINLGKLDGRQRGADAQIVTFKLKVDSGAVDGQNEINANVYYGDVKWEYEDTFYINVENEEILLRPYISTSDIITSGNKGTITVEIANAGNNDVQALELILDESRNYKLLSTSEYVYIGDLAIDDTESEDFDIYVAEGINEVNIPLTLMYEVNNHDYEENFDLKLNLLTVDEAKTIGLIKDHTKVYWTIFAVVAFILLILLIRKFSKNKR